MWAKESLRKVIRENLAGYKFVIVANREPFAHQFDKSGKIVCEKTVGGVSTTFDTVMQAAKGVWVAHGGGSADKEVVNKRDHIKVPPSGFKKYTLRRVWLTDEEVKGYYEGFSNETLWPLCHIAFIRPKFSESDWRTYKLINKRFADAVLEEIKDKKAVVWIQDYHYALLARYIREKRPDVILAQFWHIPWPTYEIFRVCPWGEEILKGMLHNDLLGFHRFYQANNFITNVRRMFESKFNSEEYTIEYKGHETKVGSFPISIDPEGVIRDTTTLGDAESKRTIREYVPFPYKYLALGVDRIDYTKGIINRLQSIELFLDKNPKYKEKFVYLGIGSPSRTRVDAYKNLGEAIQEEVQRINKKFAKNSWQPIYYFNRSVKYKDLLSFYKHADLCLVTPLDDGMNLVCKEYVAANKGGGALILSSFIGAAKELTDAFLVNPYNIKEVAQTIRKVLEADPGEKKEKIDAMKELIREKNVYRWASKFLLELAKLKK